MAKKKVVRKRASAPAAAAAEDDSAPTAEENRDKFASTTTFILLLLATGLAGVLITPYSPFWAWVITVALMLAVVIAAGYNLKGFFFGFLIDSRNRYSLSRLQTLCWTILVLSAFLTVVFINFRAGALDSLAVAIPEELWVLMGISVTSLVGSPLLVNQKRKPGAAGDDGEKKQTDVDGAEVEIDGSVAEKMKPQDAGWSDLFKGEDASNFKYLDISRIQMFYFTFILLVAYAYSLGQLFLQFGGGGELEAIDSLPAISGGMLALLGISHTAYLGSKAIPSRQALPDEPKP